MGLKVLSLAAPGSTEALPRAAFCSLVGHRGKPESALLHPRPAAAGPAKEAARPGGQLALWAQKNHMYRREKARRLPSGSRCKKRLPGPCTSHFPILGLSFSSVLCRGWYLTYFLIFYLLVNVSLICAFTSWVHTGLSCVKTRNMSPATWHMGGVRHMVVD